MKTIVECQFCMCEVFTIKWNSLKLYKAYASRNKTQYSMYIMYIHLQFPEEIWATTEGDVADQSKGQPSIDIIIVPPMEKDLPKSASE